MSWAALDDVTLPRLHNIDHSPDSSLLHANEFSFSMTQGKVPAPTLHIPLDFIVLPPIVVWFLTNAFPKGVWRWGVDGVSVLLC